MADQDIRDVVPADGVGRCSDQCPPIHGITGPMCALRHGHGGSHESEHGTTWSFMPGVDSEPAAQANAGRRWRGPRLLTWDHAEQPDLDHLARMLADLGQIHLTTVDTGDDQYAIVLSRFPLDPGQAEAIYDGHCKGEDHG